MQKNRVITVFLLLLLTAIVASSVTRLRSLSQQPSHPTPTTNKARSLSEKLAAVKTKQEWDALLNQLPTADYDAPEPNDPETRNRRRTKNSHYDKRGIVAKNPDPSITLTQVHYEGQEKWPLPTSESDVVIVSEVRDRQSYLSNDKSGVYTEFTVSVAEVLKGDPAQISQGMTITASRAGGVVRYPGGHKRLYLVSGDGLPLADGQYVMFLKSSGQDQDYRVLTMYELGPDGVNPLDEGGQFEAYRGQKNSDFIKAIKDKIATTSQPPSGKE
jgi:hypothetical protein